MFDNLLKAGYLEQWRVSATLSGVPQGSSVGPMLSNIYVDRLDKAVETNLLPAYNQGERRGYNPAYLKRMHQARRLRTQGHPEAAHALRRQAQQLPSLDTTNPTYRRLSYCRYADDLLFGVAGPREEAEEIKRQLGAMLHTLKLTRSETKTTITPARTDAAQFLGYELHVLNNNQKRDKRGHRGSNGQIGLRVPQAVVRAKTAIDQKSGKPHARAAVLHNTTYTIVAHYQQAFRGLAE